VNTVINFKVPLKAGNFLTIRVPISFSRWILHHGFIYLFVGRNRKRGKIKKEENKKTSSET
jgi:hypothetical protein